MSASLIQFSSRPESFLKEVALPSAQPRLRLLRLSVTELCNFRCRYCMPANGVPKVAHSDLLPLEGLAELVKWLAVHVGIDRVRLTGGEPLVRPGIEHLITELSVLPQIQEVSLTTNGSLLHRMAATLKAAGLKRVNVSLDSMDEERFAEVTRGGYLKQTLAGIQTAHDVGLTPIKLNAVLRRSTWKQEVPLLLDYAASTGYELRFIELMRTGTEREWCESELISVDEVCRELGTEIISKEQTRVPAQKTVMNWRGAPLTVGWITPRSHPFCAYCERLRMDARGRVRRCLMDPAMLDLAGVLGSMDGQAAQQEFQSYIAGKVRPQDMDSPLSMSQIGG